MLKQLIGMMALRTLPLGVAGVMAGTCCALAQGYFDVLITLILILLAMLLQVSTNLINSYYEERRTRDNAAVAIKLLIYIFLAISAVLFLSLFTVGGYWLLAVALLYGVCIYFMSMGSYSRRSTFAGIFITFLAFGPLLVLTSYALQKIHSVGHPEYWPMIGNVTRIGCQMGFLASMSLAVYAYTHYQKIGQAGTRALTRKHGQSAAFWLYLVLTLGFGFVSFYSNLNSRLLPHGVTALAVPCIALVIFIGVWTQLPKATPERGERLQNIVMWTSLAYYIYFFIEFAIYGTPTQDPKMYF